MTRPVYGRRQAVWLSAVFSVVWLTPPRMVLADTEELSRIPQAIQQGVDWLAQVQMSSGMFPAYECFESTLTECRQEYTGFHDTFIVYALHQVHDPRVPEIQKKTLASLRSQLEPSGWCRFYLATDPSYTQCGPDVDDTACISAALFAAGASIPDNRTALLGLRDAGGRFYTWQDPGLHSASTRQYLERLKRARGMPTDSENDVDCGVNANVLFYFSLRGDPLPEAVGYLNHVVAAGEVPRCSLYYPSALHVFYLVTRAYEVGARELTPSVPAIERHLVETQQADGSWGDELETACAIVSLLRLHFSGPALGRGIEWLLAHQRHDGSWPRARFIEPYHASEALTTALALEALDRYAKVSEPGR